MRKLTKELIDKFKMYLIEEEKSSATIEKYIRDITAFYVWLQSAELNKVAVLNYKKYLNEILRSLKRKFYAFINK